MVLKNIIFKKVFSPCVKGSFTIEAAFIVPITLLLMASAILISYDAHNVVVSQSNEIIKIIAQAPDVPEDVTSERIDITKLNGRQVLLKYLLVKNGTKKITGGLEDE